MATKKREHNLWKKSPVQFGNTLGVKNFAQIALSHTISEINAFLHFMKKFKMATKNGRKTIFGKIRQMTLQILLSGQKSLFFTPFPRCVYAFYAEIQDSL